MAVTKQWWLAEEDEVHSLVIAYVGEVERVQSDIYERFLRLAILYDPNAGGAMHGGTDRQQVTENVIASNVDTVHAVIAATEVRARFMTDDGDWSTQRTARHLEWYAEGIAKLLGIGQTCPRAFKDGALKGIGLAKVYADEFKRICVERTLVDDIIVDDGEVRAGSPRQMHHRLFVDREVLRAKFPDKGAEIDRAQKGIGRSWRFWADYRPIERDEVVCIESWRLPIGVEGEEGYKAGRRTITIDGADLVDDPWTKDHFPFARFAWSERIVGWYAIGLAERIAGHQRAINKINWQTDRQLDQLAVPTTYVRLADANLAVRTTNRAGTIVPVKGDYPHTVIPPAVSGETYQRHSTLKDSAFEESGVSRMAAQSKKPAGLDSGVALREHRDQTTQRFAQQEKGYEQFVLDTIWLALECAKELGADAPIIVRKAKQGPKRIPWAQVDMGEVKVQIAAASALSRTPAGRLQTVLEWAQAGVVSQDEARRLMQHPDLERAMSLYTAAVEDVERCIEEILDGHVLVPEPYQNVKMIIWRGQMSYLKARDDGAPEHVLENLRQFIVQAAYISTQSEMAPAQPMLPAAPGAELPGQAPPMDPSMAAEAVGPPMGPGQDMGPTMLGAGVQPATFQGS